MIMIKPETKKQADSFGIIRFISALIICIYHYNKITKGTHDDTNLPFYGAISMLYIYGGRLVELFFIISGFCFVLFSSDKIRNNKITLYKFIVHRWLKIIPAYYLSTLLILFFIFLSDKTVGSYLAGAGGRPNGILDLLLNILCFDFISPINGVAWFLSVNLFCYLVYYLIFKRCVEKNAYHAICLLIVFSTILIFCFGYTSFVSNICRGTSSFGIGCIIAIFNNHIIDIKKRKNIISSLALVSCVIMLIITRVINNNEFVWVIETFFIFPGFTLFITDNEYICSVLSKPRVAFMEKYSFSIYVFQTACMAVEYLIFACINSNVGYSKLEFLTSFMFTILIGIALNEVFIRPTDKLVKKLEDKL